MRAQRHVITAVVATLGLGASVARADRDGGLFVSGGGVIGFAHHSVADSGLLLGGELSTGYIQFLDGEHADDPGRERRLDIGTPVWVGVYGDALRDFGSDTTRLSFGPELGAKLLGVDGGLIRETGADARWGYTIRPVITVGPLAAFARYVHWNEGAEDSHWEFGLLAKLPLLPFE